MAVVLCAVSTSADTVHLAWGTSPDTVTGYRLYQNNIPITVVPATQHDYAGLTVSPGTTSTFYVTSLNGTVEGPPSNVVTVTVPAIPPAPQPTPTPSPASPDGTTVPPASQLIQPNGAVFTFGPAAPLPGNYYILRNGVNTTGWGSLLRIANSGNVYTLGGDKQCYQWIDGAQPGWLTLASTDACGVNAAPIPTPTPQPPTVESWACTVPSNPSTYSNGDKKLTIRCPSTAPFHKGDGLKVTR